MFVGDADTLVLNVAAANLYMLAVNRPFPGLVKVIMEAFSVFMEPQKHLVFSLWPSAHVHDRIAMQRYWFEFIFIIENMISLTPAFVNLRVTRTSGADLQRGAALILRNKATALYSSENKGSRSGCNMVSLQRWASYHLSSFPLLPDFTAPTWEFLFLF